MSFPYTPKASIIAKSSPRMWALYPYTNADGILESLRWILPFAGWRRIDTDTFWSKPQATTFIDGGGTYSIRLMFRVWKVDPDKLRFQFGDTYGYESPVFDWITNADSHYFLVGPWQILVIPTANYFHKLSFVYVSSLNIPPFMKVPSFAQWTDMYPGNLNCVVGGNANDFINGFAGPSLINYMAAATVRRDGTTASFDGLYAAGMPRFWGPVESSFGFTWVAQQPFRDPVSKSPAYVSFGDDIFGPTKLKGFAWDLFFLSSAQNYFTPFSTHSFDGEPCLVLRSFGSNTLVWRLPS